MAPPWPGDGLEDTRLHLGASLRRRDWKLPRPPRLEPRLDHSHPRPPPVSPPLLPSRALVLLAAVCGLLIGPHARAQKNNDFDYQVELQAPRAYRTLLRDNLDIYKWQKSPRMSLPQLRRLHAQTPEAVKELLATEGY